MEEGIGCPGEWKGEVDATEVGLSSNLSLTPPDLSKLCSSDISSKLARQLSGTFPPTLSVVAPSKLVLLSETSPALSSSDCSTYFSLEEVSF